VASPGSLLGKELTEALQFKTLDDRRQKHGFGAELVIACLGGIAHRIPERNDLPAVDQGAAAFLAVFQQWGNSRRKAKVSGKRALAFSGIAVCKISRSASVNAGTTAGSLGGMIGAADSGWIGISKRLILILPRSRSSAHGPSIGDSIRDMNFDQ
jgi:hypothetical protein